MHPFSTLLVAACLVATASGACDAIPASYVNDTFWENLNGSSYCSGVVTWPLVAGSGMSCRRWLHAGSLLVVISDASVVGGYVARMCD